MNKKVLEIFFNETEELIQTMEIGLVSLETDPGNEEQLNLIFRAAHTIKGNSGFVGLDHVVEFAHSQENVLDQLRQGRLAATPEVISLLLEAVDMLKGMIEAALHDQAVDNSAMADMVARLSGLVEAKPRSVVSEESPVEAEDDDSKYYEIRMILDPDLFMTGTDPLMLFTELGDLGQILSVEADLSGLPSLTGLDPVKLYLAWRITLESQAPLSQVENVFIFVADSSRIEITQVGAVQTDPALPEEPPDRVPGPPPVPDPAPAIEPRPAPETRTEPEPTRPASAAGVPDSAPRTEPEPGPKPTSEEDRAGSPPAPRPTLSHRPATTIRVDTAKLDKLVNLVGELVIGVARVTQIATEEQDRQRQLETAVESLDQISRELQEQVMRVRMVSVEPTFNRFQRVVRDLARELKKEVQLVLTGAETELDKNVIEQINDPLKHLIRNAVDHGLESPEKRVGLGKPARGTIWLRAYQREGSIIIEVADDGGGINRDTVLEKAFKRDLLPPQAEPAAYSDQEVYECLFHPGFSTAAEITEVSGRGVGLDVVKRNIEDLRGTVEVESKPGQGTLFRVKLPLTLAIVDGMTVKVGGETLTIPLMSIIESIRPKAEDVRAIEGSGELISFRGNYLPLVRLHELFNMPTDMTDPTKALVVILESRKRQFGVLVDEIADEIQAVIKSLEMNYYQIDGAAGATILGDGSVSLILDIHSLERMAFDDGQRHN